MPVGGGVEGKGWGNREGCGRDGGMGRGWGEGGWSWSGAVHSLGVAVLKSYPTAGAGPMPTAFTAVMMTRILESILYISCLVIGSPGVACRVKFTVTIVPGMHTDSELSTQDVMLNNVTGALLSGGEVHVRATLSKSTTEADISLWSTMAGTSGEGRKDCSQRNQSSPKPPTPICGNVDDCVLANLGTYTLLPQPPIYCYLHPQYTTTSTPYTLLPPPPIHCYPHPLYTATPTPYTLLPPPYTLLPPPPTLLPPPPIHCYPHPLYTATPTPYTLLPPPPIHCYPHPLYTATPTPYPLYTLLPPPHPLYTATPTPYTLLPPPPIHCYPHPLYTATPTLLPPPPIHCYPHPYTLLPPPPTHCYPHPLYTATPTPYTLLPPPPIHCYPHPLYTATPTPYTLLPPPPIHCYPHPLYLATPTPYTLLPPPPIHCYPHPLYTAISTPYTPPSISTLHDDGCPGGVLANAVDSHTLIHCATLLQCRGHSDIQGHYRGAVAEVQGLPDSLW